MGAEEEKQLTGNVVPEFCCSVWLRFVAVTVFRIPHYIPFVTRWLPRINTAFRRRFWKEPVKTIIVHDVEDLMQVVYFARMKNKAVKYVGGSYPINDSNCDCVINAREMKSVTAFNLNKAWLTVQSGAKLEDVLLYLRERGYTLQLYGTLPNLALVDAIAVGATASNGSLSFILQSCQVVQPNGHVYHVGWPVEYADELASLSQYSLTVVEHQGGYSSGLSEAGDVQLYTESAEAFSQYSASTRTYSRCSRTSVRLALDSVVCGLGLFGAVGMCTLKCVDLHLALEDTQILTLREMIQERHNFSSCLYVKIRCFPLISKFIVTTAVSVPPHMADWQPVWKMLLEKLLVAAYKVVAFISPYITFIYPHSAHALSAYQFHLRCWAFAMRKSCCFWPQQVVAAQSASRGENYVFPDNHFCVAIRGLVAWADRNRRLSTGPMKLSLQTLKVHNRNSPVLAPGGQSHVWALWTDYFSGWWTRAWRSRGEAEFKSTIFRANASRCWNGAPVRLSQNPHPAVARVQELRSQLGLDKTFRSAYLQDDLPPGDVSMPTAEILPIRR